MSYQETDPVAAMLARAAAEASHAPSILNTQPWRWRVHDTVLDLHADPSRRLRVIDPDGHLQTLSCGAALHHARTALAAWGCQVSVHRFPDPTDPGLLARISVDPATGGATSGRGAPADVRAYQAMRTRRTDRRPFSAFPPAPEALEVIRVAAEEQGVHLHLLRHDQVVGLTFAATHAAAAELTDAEYREELARWTQRPDPYRDGVPATTAVPATARHTVPVRDFAPGRPAGLAPGTGTDRGTNYAILYGDHDDTLAWLRAGEALSAVLLTATRLQLAASPMSDMVEVPSARQVLRRMISAVGFPYLVVRVGVPELVTGVPPTPRRHPTEVVEIAPPVE